MNKINLPPARTPPTKPPWSFAASRCALLILAYSWADSVVRIVTLSRSFRISTTIATTTSGRSTRSPTEIGTFPLPFRTAITELLTTLRRTPIPNTDIFLTPKKTLPLTHMSTPSTGTLMQMGQSLRKAASKNGATITRPARTENTSGANREALKPLQAQKALLEPTSTTSSQAMAESISPTITTALMAMSTKRVLKPRMPEAISHISKAIFLDRSFTLMPMM